MKPPILTTFPQVFSIAASVSASTIIAAPGTDLSIRIHSLFAMAYTATTNQESYFGITSTSNWYTFNSATKYATFSKDFTTPWTLDTNTAFNFYNATTGVIRVQVLADVVARNL